ncbi:MAG: hypothetical protein ACRD3W_04480, partial [Terriglobales bacterium]
MPEFGIIALTPAVLVSKNADGCPSGRAECEFSLADVSIALAASRTGATGIVNLEFADLDQPGFDEKVGAVVCELRRIAGKNCGVKFDITQLRSLKKTLGALSQFATADERAAVAVVVRDAQQDQAELRRAVEKLHALKLSVIVEAVSV